MKKIPELRFPGFNGEWRLTDLKHSCEVNPNQNKPPESFYYIDLEAVQKGLLVKEPIIINKEDAPSRAQRLLRPSDILFQTVRPYQKNNYIFNNESDLKTVASTGYAQLRAKNNYPEFIYHYIHNTSFVNKVLSRCTGTSYPAINSTDLGNVPLYLPSKEEQQKIADFFSTLDSRIEIQEEKIKNLKYQKKGYMQRIFSQELRFKDENGEDYPEWESKKIEAMLTIKHGKDQKKIEVESGKFPILGTGGEIGSTNTPLYSKPSVLIGRKGTINKPQYMDTPFWTVDTLFYSIIKEGYIPKYIYYLFNTINWLKYNEASGVPSLSAKTVDSIKVESAHVASEQQKIANFLSLFDEKIEIEKKILETLQEMKRGFLQKMFV